MKNLTTLLILILTMTTCFPSTLSSAQFEGRDVFPLRGHLVWLPMTGVNDSQMDDALAAGYDTIMLKVHPAVIGKGEGVDFTSTDELVEKAIGKGFKVLVAILGWVGLGNGEFWDTRENGERIMNRLDPFWPEAMDRMEWYYREVIWHYLKYPEVVAFAPTWGIYGEAGFTSWDAGRSEHALSRFNQWRQDLDLSALDRIPTKTAGPNTEYNRFILFRYQYVEQEFTQMIERLKPVAEGLPVGMWQELYPVIGYLWNMVEVPSADFALYESAFPFQTNHRVESSLGETMGFRYRCLSADQYREYYLPLLARKRGEGQNFMGCQLTEDYAVTNYGWSSERASRIEFDRWEDYFAPHLRRLLDEPLENSDRDVLLVFPSYAAAALPDHPRYGVDAMLMDILLRVYGCQMERVGSPRLDKMTVPEMDAFRLIVVPASSFLLSETYQRLKQTRATVLFTGAFGKALDGVLVPDGEPYTVGDAVLASGMHPGGPVQVETDHPLTESLNHQPVSTVDDNSFHYIKPSRDSRVLVSAGDRPFVSIQREGRHIFLHGQVLAATCFNPDRKPPRNLSGSADVSANEVDMWGPYDSDHPQNWFGMTLVRNILDFANVQYRVPNPKPRTVTRYLGDHMEQVSISANFVYNNTARAQTITVRTPFNPKGYDSLRVSGMHETRLTVPAFSYIALQPE